MVSVSLRLDSCWRWLLGAVLLLTGCTSFDHLTHLPPNGESGPKASQCGACHVQQHAEWQASVHAKAATGAAFLEAAGNPPEAECQQCHTPLHLRDGRMTSRSFNREEGITCISCHLVDGAMHGPHGSTALVSPHPIKEDRARYTSPALCAPCHGETLDQWQKATAGRPAPPCQECHQASVQRTASQGTNLFSDLLVAFEKKVTTRSHDINLEHMGQRPGDLTVTVTPQPPGAQTTTLEVTVLNNLPHNLPTGTFGSKEIRLVPVVGPERRRLEKQAVEIANGQKALIPGARTTVRIALEERDRRAGHLRLQLERHSQSHPDRNPIILGTTPVDPGSEAQP